MAIGWNVLRNNTKPLWGGMYTATGEVVCSTESVADPEILEGGGKYKEHIRNLRNREGWGGVGGGNPPSPPPCIHL